MWRIVYLNDMYAIMNLLSEEVAGWYEFKSEANVSDLVKALNTLGVHPRDLTAIFQSLKQSGALQADLEIL
jgi:flagellar P-ring protein precursor FlgI